MRKSKYLVLIGVLILILPIIINFINLKDYSDTISSPKGEQFTLEVDSKKPKSAAYQTYYELWIDNGPYGCGNGSWSTVASNSWCSDVNGDGSLYLIEDITLTNPDNKGSTLIIANSTVPFIIKNCTVSNSELADTHAGIKLANASNGMILDCNIMNSYDGILITYCIPYVGYSIDNIIMNNTIDTSDRYGVNILNYCNNNEVINNTVKNYDERGINLYLASDCLFENNTFVGAPTAVSGIYNYLSDSTVIRNNTIMESDEKGLYIDVSSNIIVSGNTLLNTGIYISGNMEVFHQNLIIYNNNTVNGKPVYYYKDQIGLNRNNFTYAGQPGQIILINCNYSTISNFNISYTTMGIHLLFSSHNNISNNFLRNDMGGYGMELYYDCDNNTIFNNTFINCAFRGINLYYNCNNNTIIGNSLIGCTDGINLLYFNEDNEITENRIIENDQNGIYIFYSSNYNNVTHNIIKENGRGIWLFRSDHILVYNNTCNDNLYSGISLSDAEDCRIIENNCTETAAGKSQAQGINLANKGLRNNIIGNEIHNNTQYGIFSEFCNETYIAKNDIKYNSHFPGAYIYSGICLYDSHYNNITENSIIDNKDHGIWLNGADNNNISGNVIRYNMKYGIYINNSAGISENNLIYLNFFKDNADWHVYIDAGATGNRLNNTFIGNWWDNYTGDDVLVPIGIGDDSHLIPNGFQDDLPIVDDTAPEITIIDPDAGGYIGNNAPAFTILVVEKYIYKMWYSLDDGLTNVTFSNNGTIDQELWDVVPLGSVNISFWAEDKTGKLDFEKVVVIKGTAPSPPLVGDDDDNDDDDDTGAVVVVVVVVVIASVCAGLSVIYILIKKGIIGTAKSR